MTDITYAQVWADHAVSVGEPGETITVTVESGDTVYFGDPNVTSSSYSGSITAGQSATMTNPTSWLRSASQSFVQISGVSQASNVGGFTSSFSFSGALVAVTGAAHSPAPANGTIVAIRASVGTAPTGSSVIVDVLKNDTTVFTTQANRPTIAAGTTDSVAATPDVTSVNAGDRLSVNIAQVGSTVAGSDLVVVVFIRPS